MKRAIGSFLVTPASRTNNDRVKQVHVQCFHACSKVSPGQLVDQVPLDKEPKASMAKRIISRELFPESWVELDAEVEGYDTEFFAAGDTVTAVLQ